MSITSDGGCTLNIDPAQPEDEGEYQCQVGAVSGMPAIVSDIARVTVVAAPAMPYIVQARDRDVVEVVEGEELVLDCVTHGAKPAAEIIWKDETGKVYISNILETVQTLSMQSQH